MIIFLKYNKNQYIKELSQPLVSDFNYLYNKIQRRILMDIKTRFYNYVNFDTQSDPTSSTTPSSLKQRALGNYLVRELQSLGLTTAHIDDYGIVYGRLLANTEGKDTIGFIAHMDTSPNAKGDHIRPQYITNYDGSKITLNKEKQLYLDPNDFDVLKEVIHHDIITTDGTTLLGADDKAGIAIIMQMLQTLSDNPSIKHGDIAIAFTPDEEIGRGTDHFSVAKFAADYAYTVDGSSIHEIGYENFNAYEATVTIHGRSVHPGDAKNKMISALSIAQEFDAMLPPQEKPQYTEGYEGFYHLNTMHGTCEEAAMQYILRDFNEEGMQKKIDTLHTISTYLNNKYEYTITSLTISEEYRNMHTILKQNPRSIDIAIASMRQIGLHPKAMPIRGGTDGAQLTYMGLPCPNLGTGAFNFHGPFEFVSVTMMSQGIELLLAILDNV